MSSLIPFQRLQSLTESILRAGFGYDAEEAEITAILLVEADARGIPSHGVSRLAFYRANLDAGHCRPGVEPEVVWRTPVSMVVDGRAGVGPLVASRCVDLVVEAAEATGVALCAVRNSNHYGIAGYWAELMAKRGLIGASLTNTYIAGVPTFGLSRLLGTNPICVAIPEDHGRIFMLDMATTTISHGKVELYDRRGKAMPKGWVVDERGVEASDATAFEKTFYQTSLGGHLYLGGAGEESGGHKGYGLALMVELLCSGLSQGLCSPLTYAKGGAGGVAHFFAAARLDLFGEPGASGSHVGGIHQRIRDGARIPGHDRIWIHGEKEAEARAKALAEGVYLDGATRSHLLGLIGRLGLEGVDGLDDGF
jgi:LDH2 family malate/lactate/ureidoglycolate dehydrogenase